MKHWDETVVTDVGNEMLNEMMAGRFLTVTEAYGGTGLVNAEELAHQTDLLERKQTVSIINDETTSEGRTITLQIKNAEAEYELNQIGIFAKLDAARDPQAKAKMLCIMQDRQEKGAIIVPSAEDPTFVLELYCIIKISNDGRFEVTVDKTGIVSLAYLEKRLSEIQSVPGEGAPTPQTAGKPGQHYFDEKTGVEYICKKVNGDGTFVWEETGSVMVDDADQKTKFRLGVESGQLYIQTVQE